MKRFNAARLGDQALELIAERFKALSEVNRLKIIIALEPGELNVTNLGKQTGLSQTNLSRHLQTLVETGILGRRKHGLAVFYFIADPTIFAICENVCSGLSKRLAKQATVFHDTEQS